MYKTSVVLLCSIAAFQQLQAQNGDAYHAPNQEAIRSATYKRQQAQSDQHFKDIAPASKPSSVGTATPAASAGNYSPYAAEHQATVDAITKKENARMAAWEAKENKFKALSANVPKNEENYKRLVELAEQAGFDYYDATRINGRYAPKVIALPYLIGYEKQKFDAYIQRAEECKTNKWPDVQVKYLMSALEISDDPHIRFKAASIYYDELKNYDSAAAQYDHIQRSPITNKPAISSVYQKWGKASLMANDYATAIHVLSVYREFYKDEDASFHLSYAYFLNKNYDAAFGQLMEASTYPRLTHLNNLLQNYYLIQNGATAEAAELFEKNKAANADVKLSGNTKKDLSMMLYKYAREGNKADISIHTFYLLDVAVALDPANMDFIETRYGYNTKMKRMKQAREDEAILSN